MLADAQQLLNQHFRHPTFRPHQVRVIEPVIAGRDVLAVLPTGGGKSLCFQLPAMLAPDPTLVISPLIALMQDQVGRLQRAGVVAAMLSGELGTGERERVLRQLKRGEVRLLYVSPERLGQLSAEIVRREIKIGRLAVDEAHCVVEWGHDFRPAYRQIGAIRKLLGWPPCIALTGSATTTVRQEIASSLGLAADTVVVVGSFDRHNLRFRVERVHSIDERLARMIRLVRAQTRPSIVYGPTRNLVEGIARALRGVGVNALPYHAGIKADERRVVLDQFLDDRIQVVSATCAFGLGIDKPDVGLVAHWSAPPSPESYYQEAGRAGRDGRLAECVLFHHAADTTSAKRQLAVTYPDEQLVESLWRNPAHRQRHPAGLLASVDRLANELRPDRGPVDWRGVRRRRREAERRIAAITTYATTPHCRRSVLMGYFGESIRRCSGCDRCIA